MGLIGAALEFRMILYADIEPGIGNFHGFHNIIIGRGSADDKSFFFQHIPEVVVKLITMAVTLGDMLFPVGPVHLGAWTNVAGIGSQTQGTALGNMLILIRQKIDDLML